MNINIRIHQIRVLWREQNVSTGSWDIENRIGIVRPDSSLDVSENVKAYGRIGSLTGTMTTDSKWKERCWVQQMLDILLVPPTVFYFSLPKREYHDCHYTIQGWLLTLDFLASCTPSKPWETTSRCSVVLLWTIDGETPKFRGFDGLELWGF